MKSKKEIQRVDGQISYDEDLLITRGKESLPQRVDNTFLHPDRDYPSGISADSPRARGSAGQTSRSSRFARLSMPSSEITSDFFLFQSRAAITVVSRMREGDRRAAIAFEIHWIYIIRAATGRGTRLIRSDPRLRSSRFRCRNKITPNAQRRAGRGEDYRRSSRRRNPRARAVCAYARVHVRGILSNIPFVRAAL